ncbi:MAG TPA: sigma-70 family RNA polymerase sigma factor [Pyrinomonadaceae bacterium]|nr:sigma-70 family RNA polymerase sigma factor [Pyrinomonadaceae bacterium]
MFFSRSITLDEDDLSNVAAAARLTTAASADADFIEKLRDGDAEAFDTLVQRYSGDIYALLFRLTDSAEEAGDLTQETFMSALKAIRAFRGDSELKTWLFRIAVNHSRNRFRWWKRRRRDATVSLESTIGGSDLQIQETLASQSPGPEEAAIRNERERSLRAALSELPEIFRTAVILCDIEGLSYEEISQTLELNLGTVKSRIARGRSELRKMLKDI